MPTIFAAASLKPALDTLAAAGALGHPAPRLVYAASSQLARQVVQGAPADLFISADEDWMDYVAKHGMLAKGSRHDLLGNTLVLVGADKQAPAIDLHDSNSVLAALGDGRLALALPDSVPAGRYARAALKSLHLWSALKDHLAPARDV
ncbi:MAG: molybdate ABC transporter substrate-binding protein, partial [Xanthomonadales bacterium]|nr:molybdate ABC transporter substrate-binding protein [Xanthomonadales bacterium]